MKTARLANGVVITFPTEWSKGEIDAFVRRASGAQESSPNSQVKVQLPDVNIPDIHIPPIVIPPIPEIKLPTIHVAEGAPEVLQAIADNLLGVQEGISTLTQELSAARKEIVRVSREEQQNMSKQAAEIRSQMALSSKIVSDVGKLMTQALMRKKRVVTDKDGNPISIE